MKKHTPVICLILLQLCTEVFAQTVSDNMNQLGSTIGIFVGCGRDSSSDNLVNRLEAFSTKVPADIRTYISESFKKGAYEATFFNPQTGKWVKLDCKKINENRSRLLKDADELLAAFEKRIQ